MKIKKREQIILSKGVQNGLMEDSTFKLVVS